MVEKLGKQNAADFTGRAVIGSGVVDNFGSRAAPRHNHRVPRRRLAELPVKEQVAGQRRAHIAADEVRVALDERSGVGKLRKCAVGQIIGRSNAPGFTRKSAVPSGECG